MPAALLVYFIIIFIFIFCLVCIPPPVTMEWADEPEEIGADVAIGGKGGEKGGGDGEGGGGRG